MHFTLNLLFLNTDLYEPTTSKGFRHVRMDVQCGSDTSINYSPKMDVEIGNITSDFGACTKYDEDGAFSARCLTKGICIRDSDLQFDKPKSSEIYYSQEIYRKSDTKILKTVSSRAKIQESGSDLCGSVGSFSKSPFYFYDGVTEKTSSTLVNAMNKLSCDTIHVHSFKERQSSEDVICQGRWQPRELKSRNNSRMNNVIYVKTKINRIHSKSAIDKAKVNFSQKKGTSIPQAQKKQIQRISKSIINSDVCKKTNLQKNKAPSISKTLYKVKSVHKVTYRVYCTIEFYIF